MLCDIYLERTVQLISPLTFSIYFLLFIIVYNRSAVIIHSTFAESSVTAKSNLIGVLRTLD